MHISSMLSILFALATAVSATPVPEKDYLAARDALAELQPRRFKVCASLFEDCGVSRGRLPCCGLLVCKGWTCAETRVNPAPWGKA
ncbi:hypothetical protein LY76DRAFT_599293 [Colletotrichum caudatum]|nr:hypothetical protein LY76DRAFT_599293 [Colletotrichum caudatum]